MLCEKSEENGKVAIINTVEECVGLLKLPSGEVRVKGFGEWFVGYKKIINRGHEYVLYTLFIK